MVQSEQIIRHKLLNWRGMTLAIPAHLVGVQVGAYSDIDIYASSTGQLFPLSTRLEFADGRLFRYGRFGEANTSAPIARMVVNGNLVPGSAATNGYEGTLDTTSLFAAGTKTLIMNDTTDRVLNAYEDGMLAVFPANHFVEYRILGNDAATSVDDVTIYLETGLKTALVVGASGSGITAYPSIFYNLMAPPEDATFDAFMGVCLAASIASGSFGWIQRRGRAIITPTVYFGDTANERMAQGHTDGTIALKAADATQTVGYLTQKTVSGYGDLEVWLQFE